MRRYIAIGTQQLQRAADTIRALNPKRPWRIEITQHQAKRTLSQNKLYFSILTEMANETGYTKDEMHDIMKTKLLPPQVVSLADEEITIPATTTTLGKKEFSDYVDRVCAFAATELGIVV